MSAQPTISIGLPVHNGLPYVRDLIESLLAQTFSDFEVIISDNASTDGTGELCRAYARADRRIKYLRNRENIGLGPNFNLVLEHASARYYKWAAADDLYEPEYLEVCLPPIRDDPAISVSHCRTVLVDDAGRPLPYNESLNACIDAQTGRIWLLDDDQCATHGRPAWRFRDVVTQQIMCGPVYGLMPRELLKKTGLQKSFFGSDKLLLAELALLGRFHISQRKLFKKRMHSKMTSVMNGIALQRNIDPTVRLRSLRLTKLKSYIAMIARQNLSISERAICLASLFAHSATVFIPEMYRYRPKLISQQMRFKARAGAITTYRDSCH